MFAMARCENLATVKISYAPVLLHCEAMGYEVVMGEAIEDRPVRRLERPF